MKILLWDAMRISRREKGNNTCFGKKLIMTLSRGIFQGEYLKEIIIIYFCKNHNMLCCAFCITKIKEDGNGQHKDCDVCSIRDIEKEKKNKLKENIENLEQLSLNLQQSINEIKNSFEKLEKDKEKMKTNIQNIFTKLEMN